MGEGRPGAPLPAAARVTAAKEAWALVGVPPACAIAAMLSASVGVTTSGYARGGMVVVGILVSLFGIVGVLNPAYMKDAIWKK